MPHCSARRLASCRSRRFKLALAEVTARAFSPSACAATKATRELSTPPEKATSALPSWLKRSLSAAYLARICGGMPDGMPDGGECLSLRRIADQSRLIRLARWPAPKPLSMFTTARPEAQLDSMPSRAVRPPKDAP